MTNTFFEEMKEAGYAYQEAKDKRLETRTELIKADIEPEDEISRMAYMVLLKKYN